MLLFQPVKLNHFSVIIHGHHATLSLGNSSYTCSEGILQSSILWQNQAPLTPTMTIDLSTAMANYQNQVINLTVAGSDKTTGVSEFISAYIVSLPNGTECVGAQLF